MEYHIQSKHTVFEDHFEEGEQSYSNEYNENSDVEASDIKEALIKYFDFLSFTLDTSKLDITNDNGNAYYSVLVNVEGEEADENEVKQWKKGNLILYSNLIELSVFVKSKIVL